MDEFKKRIRDLIRKESLRVIKESQASFLSEASSLEKTMKDVNDAIGLYEKRLDKLNGEEEKAKDKEDFSDLKRIKGEQLEELSGLIRAYSKKVEMLKKQQIELKGEVDDVISKGANVFNNRELQEFENEKFKKGWGLQINTHNSFNKMVKILDDANAYKVVSTDIDGLQPGDLLKLPNMKIGGGGNVTVYRNVDGRQQEVGTFKYDNVTSIIKNPQG